MATIDIPFPLSLLSCFAFRGFVSKPPRRLAGEPVVTTLLAAALLYNRRVLCRPIGKTAKPGAMPPAAKIGIVLSVR